MEVHSNDRMLRLQRDHGKIVTITDSRTKLYIYRDRMLFAIIIRLSKQANKFAVSDSHCSGLLEKSIRMMQTEGASQATREAFYFPEKSLHS